MEEHAEREERASAQWPVAITLVLCALFAAAISLKARADWQEHRADALASVAAEARTEAARLDAVAAPVLAQIVTLAATQPVPAAVLQAAGLSRIEAVAGFGPDGAVVEPGTASPADLGALLAAGEVAQASGWSGAVARPGGTVSLAVAARAPDGSRLAGLVDLGGLEPAGPGRQVLVSDGRGALVAAAPALERPFETQVQEAYDVPLPDAAEGATARFATAPDGRGVILGTAPSASGLLVHVTRDRAAVEATALRDMAFWALLFLGPVLAFCGIWFLVRGQSERFSTVRTQLRDAERRLRIAIEGARCGVWDWDLTADRVYLTQRLARTFGLSGAGRFDTEDVLAALGRDDQARLRAALAASVQIGVIDITVKVQASGAGRPASHVQLRGRAAADRRAPDRVRIIGVSIDVSEQRDVETKVIAAERRLRDAIDAISGPFALWDRDRRLVLWNDGFARAFELDGSALRAGADYVTVSKAAARAVVSQRSDRDDDRVQEVELRNGTWIQLVERETSEGGLVSIGVDVTTMKETEESILRSERQMRSVVTELERSEREAADLAEKYAVQKLRAEEASSAKSSFLANMSHELRTPLNAINGFSQMMVQQIYGPLGDPRYAGYAEDILSSGNHLLELINDVLDMAKIEAGKFTIHPKPMHLEDVVDQAVRVLRGRAEERRVVIETDLGDRDEMTADARAIKQILINLVSNAVKFTEPGGRVLIQSRGNLQSVTIRVVDTGVGIAPEHLSRLGNPFEQVENEHAKSHQGSGLGLALCRSFAEMHGGTMTLSSEIGVGTMVTVTLPRHVQAGALEAA